LEFFPRHIDSSLSPSHVQVHRVAVILIAIICGSIYPIWVSWCDGLSWAFFVDGDPWIFLTVANLGSFRIANWARVSRPSYSPLLAPQAFCNSVIIPPGSNSPRVESSNSASLATRRTSSQYSVTHRLPCFMFFSLMLASPLASITPNCLCNSALNPA